MSKNRILEIVQLHREGKTVLEILNAGYSKDEVIKAVHFGAFRKKKFNWRRFLYRWFGWLEKWKLNREAEQRMKEFTKK